MAYSSRLQSLFRDYADYHRHPTNQLCHKIAIPLIVFHIIAMLDWVRLGGSITAAHLAFAAVVAWYLTLDLGLALVMALFFALCFPLAWVTPPWLVWAIAGVAWSIQLAGHTLWEKRAPAFLTNVAQIFVGPLFFAAKIMGKNPINIDT